MAALFLGVGLYKYTLDTDTSTTPQKYRFCDGHNISTIFATDSNNSSDVIIQVLEITKNQN